MKNTKIILLLLVGTITGSLATYAVQHVLNPINKIYTTKNLTLEKAEFAHLAAMLEQTKDRDITLAKRIEIAEQLVELINTDPALQQAKQNTANFIHNYQIRLEQEFSNLGKKKQITDEDQNSMLQKNELLAIANQRLQALTKLTASNQQLEFLIEVRDVRNGDEELFWYTRQQAKESRAKNPDFTPIPR